MNNQKKILIVFGTRPESIKMAPLVNEFLNDTKSFITKVCVTAQHREMLDQVMEFFKLKADYDLNLMKPNQNLYSITADIIINLKKILDQFDPDFVFVHGDTTTSMAASLASFYHGSKVCHIEAGLRTNNKLSPFPEEINRQITSRISDYHFAPTLKSKNNLIKENINKNNIIVTGNTVIDALLMSIKKINKNPSSLIKSIYNKISNKDVILVTAHRRENHGDGFVRICKALKFIALSSPNIIIVYPVHLNPNVLQPVNKYLSNIDNILLLEPLDYKDFIWMMNYSKLILTDSGGVQEEAPSLGKPVLVMRNNTERPEAVEEGTVLLVGTNTDLIIKETLNLLNNKIEYNKMALKNNPYGDGKASYRIIKFLKKNII